MTFKALRACLLYLYEIGQMKEAIRDQLAIEDYQRFVSKVPRIEGVWDDHDYGGEESRVGIMSLGAFASSTELESVNRFE